MKFAEDLSIGTVVPCGTAVFERDEIIHFAREFDPQPFHLDDAEATRSLFGALTASGLQVSAFGQRSVLSTVMRNVCYLGSPGVKHMQMHRPVFVNNVLRFEHRFEKITWLEQWPGVALAEGRTEAFNQDDTLIMTIEDLSWIGSRKLAIKDDLPAALARSPQASDVLGPMTFDLAFVDEPDIQPPTDRVFLEDCSPGTTFVSQWIDVDAAELKHFQAIYDPPADNAAPNGVFRNNWVNSGVLAKAVGDAFWKRAENAGGGGLLLARWPIPVQGGDRLRGRMTVREARQLRSRPLMGVCQVEGVCVNQRNEIVATYRAIPFVRMRG